MTVKYLAEVRFLGQMVQLSGRYYDRVDAEKEAKLVCACLGLEHYNIIQEIELPRS